MDGVEVYVTSQNGYGVVLWKKGDLLYSLVSELLPEELLGVRQGDGNDLNPVLPAFVWAQARTAALRW